VLARVQADQRPRVWQGQRRLHGTGADYYYSSSYSICMFLYISHIIQLTPQKLSAEPRNSASAETLAVARRPNEASRETIMGQVGLTRGASYSSSSYSYFVIFIMGQVHAAPPQLS